jgi:hypothetical protein
MLYVGDYKIHAAKSLHDHFMCDFWICRWLARPTVTNDILEKIGFVKSPGAGANQTRIVLAAVDAANRVGAVHSVATLRTF